MLLGTVIGTMSMPGKPKELDLKFPSSFLKNFRGPKFGTQGILRLLGVDRRLLLNKMIKPCTGHTPEAGAKLFSRGSSRGAYVTKDDALIAGPASCLLLDRVKLYMAGPNTS